MPVAHCRIKSAMTARRTRCLPAASLALPGTPPRLQIGTCGSERSQTPCSGDFAAHSEDVAPRDDCRQRHAGKGRNPQAAASAAESLDWRDVISAEQPRCRQRQRERNRAGQHDDAAVRRGDIAQRMAQLEQQVQLVAVLLHQQRDGEHEDEQGA